MFAEISVNETWARLWWDAYVARDNIWSWPSQSYCYYLHIKESKQVNTTYLYDWISLSMWLRQIPYTQCNKKGFNNYKLAVYLIVYQVSWFGKVIYFKLWINVTGDTNICNNSSRSTSLKALLKSSKVDTLVIHAK